MIHVFFERSDQLHVLLIHHMCCYIKVIPSPQCFFILILADGGRNSSCGPTGYGHVWHLRSVRQSLPPARQKEEIWNKSSSQDTEPRLQWNIYLQGEQINGEGILHGDIKYRHFSTHFLKAVNFWYIIKGCYDVLVWIVCIIVSVYALLIFSWHTEMRTY